MPAQRGPRIPDPRRRRTAVLVLAATWLALLLGIGAARSVAASPLQGLVRSSALADATPTNTPTSAATSSATSTASASPSVSPSVTADPTGTSTSTATSTATATDTATAGSTDTGGGNYGEQSGGAEPTKVVFTQPTGGGSNGGPLQGLTSGAFTSNGLLVAGAMSCIVSLLGIIVAVVAFSALVRGGYGPFLRALVRGKRAGKGGKAGAGGGAEPGELAFADSRADWDVSDEVGALSESYEVPARGRGYAAQPSRSPRGPAPGRRRDDW